MANTPRYGESGIVRSTRTAAQARGNTAETLAEQHLTRHGLRTLARNVRCRGGEIDLVCLDGGTVVFVEVRLRSNPRFGGAAESITRSKRQRIALAAQWWLGGAGRAHRDRPCRFDAVLLTRADDDAIDWIRAAFDMADA